MGNLISSCFAPKVEKKKKSRASLSKRFSNPPPLGNGGGGGIGSSNRFSKMRSSRKDRHEEALIQEQALAAAALLLQHQQQNGGSGLGGLPFDRSASLRYPAPGPKKQALPRSSSSRSRSLTDLLLQPQQLVNQPPKTSINDPQGSIIVRWAYLDVPHCLSQTLFTGISNDDLNIDALETNHFVLVHGGGFGAWCWYRTIALLEEGGFKVDAIDLTGSGIHSFDTNNIKTLSQYVKPLTDFLERLDEGQKVILVGHDFGGTCISYAMEEFPLKVAKAIFISAAMLRNGQSTLDMFSQQPGLNEPMLAAQKMLYANGTNCPPTAIDLDKGLLGELFFNRSPTKDVALASVSLRPIPFAPILEKLSLTDGKYGSVRRFYIETSEDNVIPLTLQQIMINANPPEGVFRLKGGDHAPFFSKPQALHKLLVEIAKIPWAPARAIKCTAGAPVSVLHRLPQEAATADDPPPAMSDQTIRPIQKHGDDEPIPTSSTMFVFDHIYTVRPVTTTLP
ncbi:putative methylesterase 11, chloroplastic [Asimina triloba]